MRRLWQKVDAVLSPTIPDPTERMWRRWGAAGLLAWALLLLRYAVARVTQH
jgi:hypothetical protein